MSAKQGGHVCIYQQRVGSRADVPMGRGSMRAQPAQRRHVDEDSNCTVGRVWGGQQRSVHEAEKGRVRSLLRASGLWSPEQHLLWGGLDRRTCLLQAVSSLSCPLHLFPAPDAAQSLASTDYSHGANRTVFGGGPAQENPEVVHAVALFLQNPLPLPCPRWYHLRPLPCFICNV